MSNVYWNQDNNQKSPMPGLWTVVAAQHDVPVWTLGAVHEVRHAIFGQF